MSIFKAVLSVIVMICICECANASTLIMYEFEQTNGFWSPTQSTPQTSSGGYLPSSILNIPTIGTCADCGNPGWGWYGQFGYVNPTYTRFTLIISTGYVATVTNVSFHSKRTSSLNPTSYDIQYSLNNTNYSIIGSGALSGTSWQIINANNSGVAITGLTGIVYFRIWGYNATGQANWDHDNVKIEGLVVASSSSNNAPTNIVLSSTNVAENLPVGTKVGNFTTQDPDAGETFVYSLTNGTGSADNGSFTISGSNLLTAAIFNYEVKSNYSIRVQSADQGGLSTQKVFAINIVDVNEPPPSFSEAPSLTGSNMVIRWGSITNKKYTVHFSTNLLSGFSVLQSNIPGTPAVNSYTDTLTIVTQKYWKVTTDP